MLGLLDAVRENLLDLSSGVNSSVSEPGINSSSSPSSATASSLIEYRAGLLLRGAVDGSMPHDIKAPREAEMPDLALSSPSWVSATANVDCAPGAGNVDDNSPVCGEVPGEKPLTRAIRADARGGEPMGPRSMLLLSSASICLSAEGVLTGSGEEDAASSSRVGSTGCVSSREASGTFSGEAGEEPSSSEIVEALPCAGALGSLLLSSGRPNDAKSVFWTGGAGVEGDRVAFMGRGRVDNGRVGAVEPDRRELRDEPLCGPAPGPFGTLPPLCPSRGAEPLELPALAAA